MMPRGNQGGQLARREEHPFRQLRRSLDTLFDSFWGGFGEEFEPLRVWDFDVREGDKEIAVRAEMPGFDEKDLDVQINDNVLTIRAQEEKKGDGREEYRSFYRSITLPSGIDAEKVQATYHNGVLEMHIPRSAGARPKRIEVKGQQGAVAQRSQTGSGKANQTATGSKSNPTESKNPEKARK
jgi:HSP20 family protein